MKKTVKNLVNWLRAFVGLISIANLLACFFFWILAINIWRSLSRIVLLTINTNFIFLDIKSSLIGMSISFGISLIFIVLFWYHSYHIQQWKMKKWTFYNLFFIMPFGFLTFYYFINSGYWGLENGQFDYVLKSPKEVIDHLPPKEIQKPLYNREKIIAKTKLQFQTLEKNGLIKEANFLAQKIFHQSSWKTINFDQVSIKDFFTFKAVLERVPRKDLLKVSFNLQLHTDYNFAFGLVNDRLKAKQQYLQVFLVIDRTITTYEELVELTYQLKQVFQSIDSVFVGVYTNKVHKIYFNRPKK
ncbi:membrane protein YdbS with pleckstrin-like domain [Mycoplasmoides fastidiosum]|uniref:Membrane protein YdbS with pleckstrin-like domain n=1 Tax=Mycoplasmoides fastidiosum TaxID=92758 RepID=A0ABU0LYD4_9BACT|nr:hypothetical protein [Mycoplasmoides fastidiosum]MDQ0513726.1 membrane protein YdbS with pleckstrin-like domain [Mycoplasmoides fastidiosum]UUD37852.1 hypothetical protein NPA10_00440 [Mycoplasmoides fastidiosum]